MPTVQVSPPSSASLTLRKGQARLFCSPAGRNQKCHVSTRAAVNQESTTDLGVDFGDLWKAYSGTASKVESNVNNATQAAKAAVSDNAEQAATNIQSASEQPAEAAQAGSSEVEETEEEEYYYDDEEEDCSGEEYDSAQASGYAEDEGGEADAAEGAPEGTLQADGSGGEGLESTGDAVSTAADGAADGAADSLSAASDAVNQFGDGVGKEVEKAGDALSGGGSGLASESASKLSKSGAFDAGSSGAQQAADSLSQSTDTGASAAGGLAESATSAADSVASKAAKAFGSASPSDASPLDSVTASFSDLTQGLRDKAADAKASASQALNGLTGDLREQVESFSSGLSKQVEGQVGDVSGALGKRVEGVSEGVNKQLGGVTVLAQDAASQLNSAKEAAAEAVAGVSGQLLDQTATAVSGLPPPVRDAVYAAAAVLSKAFADPLVAQTTVGASVTIPFLLWVTNRFGGYSGLLKPERTAVILEEENAVLLDIRPEEQRQAAGIPDLRFEARSKGFALPQLEISKRSYSQLSKAEALELQLATTLIQGLYKVTPSTKVIVLDDSQPRAVKLARAIRSNIGLRAYVLEGGFKAWASAGLPVKEADDYEVTTLDTLSDTIERLREPVRAVITISLAFLSVAAVYDVHKTLQFVGTFGLIATFGTAPYRFATVGEAAKTLLGPLAVVAGLVGSTLPKSRPTSQPVAAQDDVGADYEEGVDESVKETETDSGSFNEDAETTGVESGSAPVQSADKDASPAEAKSKT